MNNKIDWPIKKWISQYLILYPLIAGLLSAIQYMKGRSIEYSIEFGLIWAGVSIAIFAVNRVYYFKKNIPCAVCNDIHLKPTE